MLNINARVVVFFTLAISTNNALIVRMLLYSVYIGALDLGMILKYKPGRLVPHVCGNN